VHNRWVDSRALRLIGATADTPDPADGRNGRDEHGAPVGPLFEGVSTPAEAISTVSPTPPASTTFPTAMTPGSGCAARRGGISKASGSVTTSSSAGRGVASARRQRRRGPRVTAQRLVQPSRSSAVSASSPPIHLPQIYH
jgi:hypothetical protein